MRSRNVRVPLYIYIYMYPMLLNLLYTYNKSKISSLTCVFIRPHKIYHKRYFKNILVRLR